jgi:aspartyl-tRNA(Asn)/glutamyl-tRNA(Gln) amidotransferase subunit C
VDKRMSLTREEVNQVSLLARLQFDDAELDRLTSELSQIVTYVEQLAELDTDEVEPMAHGVQQYNVFADDVRHESLGRVQALANAPKRDDECYRVPPVLGE